MNVMEEKLALKELVDTFSILADQKDTDAQAMLFTEDATLKSYRGEELLSQQQGRQAIGNACGQFLALFDTVFHINGQQVAALTDDTHATGTAYCQVVLIGLDASGQRTMTSQGTWYDDRYVKMDGKWLIANRTSHFVWSDSKAV